MALLLAGGVSTPAGAACTAWDAGGNWSIIQDNQKSNPEFDLVMDASGGISGSAKAFKTDKAEEIVGALLNADLREVIEGQVDGILDGNAIILNVVWSVGNTGVYEGMIGPDGRVEGVTFDKANPSVTIRWQSEAALRCATGAGFPPSMGGTPPGGIPPSGGLSQSTGNTVDLSAADREITAKYGALGGGNGGGIGAARGATFEAPHGGFCRRYQHGSICWHPQIGEAFAVWGRIHEKWEMVGQVEFGYPITDETTTPDGRGRFNHFRRMDRMGELEASIYWTPETGAVAVYGLIRDAWAKQGWERGPLGYPTRDEYQDGNFRRSNFERGSILWAPDMGVTPRIVPAVTIPRP